MQSGTQICEASVGSLQATIRGEIGNIHSFSIEISTGSEINKLDLHDGVGI